MKNQMGVILRGYGWKNFRSYLYTSISGEGEAIESRLRYSVLQDSINRIAC